MREYRRHCPPSKVRDQEEKNKIYKELLKLTNPAAQIIAAHMEKNGEVVSRELKEAEILKIEEDHIGRFCFGSEMALQDFYSDAPMIPQRQVNKHLQKLHSVLKHLPKQVKEILETREISLHPGTVSLPDVPDKDWDENTLRVIKGGSALDILLNISSENEALPTHVDAMRRHSLITHAMINFAMHGGEILAGAETPFAKYLFDLFMDAKIEEVDISKAIRDYVKKKKYKNGVIDLSRTFTA